MAGEKVCVVCREDCSNRPRAKDSQGRYVCGTCLEERKARKAQQAAQPATQPARKPERSSQPNPQPDPMVAALIGDIPDPTAPENQCPNCAKLIQPGSAICMNCGFNIASGKKIRTQVAKAQKEPKASSGPAIPTVTGGVVVLVVGVLGLLGLPALAAMSPGGAMGATALAGAWALIAYIMMIVAAFMDDEGKWGIYGLLAIIPCIGLIPGAAFAFYYCTIGSERTSWKANYWLAVVANVAVSVTVMLMHPATFEQLHS